jgi:hypothetical protein
MPEEKKLTRMQLEDLRELKIKQLKDFLNAQPPEQSGEDLVSLWETLYDEDVKNTVVKTIFGPSDDYENYVYPYEKIQAIVGDGDDWKWPRMWQRFDEIERRGPAYRDGEPLNFNQPNKNPDIVSQKVLVVGGGPIGLRVAIELMMGGHQAICVEKRREIKNEDGSFKQLGFTNRINRPHMWQFVRNDLAKLNGKDFMNQKAAYPVFTEPETMSIGIDELQCLLLKNALLLGVDFRLGCGYVNARIKFDETTMMPHWDTDLKYDEHAAKYFGAEVGMNVEDFQCLVGCDSSRSAVRETQAKFFGNIEKRKFMDCVGIVANVQKCTKKRLKEMGYDGGIEPSDMNRSKMVFKEFFGKIQLEADADIESLIYYKAALHNYTIIVPKRQDMVKHGLPGAVFSFAEGRESGNNKSAEKDILKAYCAKVLKSAGIPLDEQLDNHGFVKAPNDCMAFDFAECWNTKKSMSFNYPPPGYDVEEDGDWEGRKIIPLVCLAGDALMEPFWPLGLGLKRGWQAIMDTNYAIDNLFNRLCLCARKGGDPEEFSWEEHYEALAEQAVNNFEFCSRQQVSEQLISGEWPDKGLVMSQLKKKFKDAEKPAYEVEIDPWTRYLPLEKEWGDIWKKMTKEEQAAYLHPAVKKYMGKQDFYRENAKPGGKSGEIDYKGKELVSINGKVAGGFKQAGTQKLNKDGTKKKPAAAPKAKGRGRGAAAAAAEAPAEA